MVIIIIKFSFFHTNNLNRINFLNHSNEADNIKNVKIYFILFPYIIIFSAIFYFNLIYYYDSINKNNFNNITHLSKVGLYGYLFEDLIIINKTSVVSANINSETDQPYTQPLKPLQKLQFDLASIASLNSIKNASYPLTKLNKPNIIFYQLESAISWPMLQNPNPMPFLSEIIKKYNSSKNFFSNGCSTINTEFSSLCSFFPDTNGPISDLYSSNDYYCLPEILKNNFGYTTAIFHANNMEFWNREVLAPKWGFDNYFFAPEYYNIRESDDRLLTDVVKKIKNSTNPYFAYLIGFTSHSPHNQEYIDSNKKNNYFNIMPYQEQLNGISKSIKLDEESLRIYLGFMHYLDQTIKSLFDDLAKENLLDNTIVVIFSDHKYYNVVLEDKVQQFYHENSLPFVMYVPKNNFGQISDNASHLDIAPSILDLITDGNIFKPDSFVGQSLFSGQQANNVLNKCLGKSFYVDNNIILENYSKLGITQPIAYLNPLIEKSFEDYSKLLKDINNSSDFILKENLLVSSIDEKNKNNTPEIAYDQITDSDKDGLSDLREEALGTNKLNADSDGDGYKDGEEVLAGYDPLSSSSVKIENEKRNDNEGILKPNLGLSNYIIAHALGSINDTLNTNSLEAFQTNYSKGFKLFEVDLSLTKDGQLVALHDNHEIYVNLSKKISETTYWEFKNLKFKDNYTVLGFPDLIELLKQNQDIYFILDFKDDFQTSINRVKRYFSKNDLNLLDRIIPQIYQPEDLIIAQNIHPFKDIIFTLYRSNFSDDQVIDFIKDNKAITAVTMSWDNRYSKKFADRIKNESVGVYVHTVNSFDKINFFINNKIGIYTDFLNIL